MDIRKPAPRAMARTGRVTLSVILGFLLLGAWAPATPASAATALRIAFTRIGIYPRAEASMQSAKVGNALPDGAVVSVECEAEGAATSNASETSTVWERLTNGTWIPNVFVDSGYLGWTPGVPRCEQPGAAETPQQSNSVGCWGDYCSGQDPQSTGCATDAVTVAVLVDDKGGGRLDLRWSPTCKTNWARWQQYPTGWCMNCTPIGVYAVQEGGYMQSADLTNDPPRGGDTRWSPMIYSPDRRVAAGVWWPCGDAGILKAAMDCAFNGKTETAAK